LTDTEQAREHVAEVYEAQGATAVASRIRAGLEDRDESVMAVLAAIRKERKRCAAIVADNPVFTPHEECLRDMLADAIRKEPSPLTPPAQGSGAEGHEELSPEEFNEIAERHG
jgi:hypothetical protein